MRRALLTLFVVFTALASKASTFVGNGGHTGDVELLVVKKQLQDIYPLFLDEESKDVSLCECIQKFEGHGICEPLRNLNTDQRYFCSSLLREQASELLKLINGPHPVRLTWTNENVEVHENRGLRAVEAVANPAAHEITIHQKRFLEMRAYERIFLLTHELMHFVQINNKFLSDEAPIGPFTEADGGRQLINAIAAATVMHGADHELIGKYQSHLYRSQGWRRNWLDLHFGGTAIDKDTDRSYAIEHRARVQANYRQYLSPNWGFVLSYRDETGEKQILTTIDAKEEVRSVGAGVTYRYFPFQDPLTFWGQSHLSVQLLAEYLTAQYNLKDPQVSLDESSQVWGSSLQIFYQMPLRWDLWWHIGGGYHFYSYEYSQLSLKYGSHHLAWFGGISYAF